MAGKKGFKLMNIMPGSKEEQPNELTGSLSGLKIKFSRDMLKEERNKLVNYSCMPVLIELEDDSQIWAFIPEIHLGRKATDRIKD